MIFVSWPFISHFALASSIVYIISVLYPRFASTALQLACAHNHCSCWLKKIDQIRAGSNKRRSFFTRVSRKAPSDACWQRRDARPGAMASGGTRCGDGEASHGGVHDRQCWTVSPLIWKHFQDGADLQNGRMSKCDCNVCPRPDLADIQVDRRRWTLASATYTRTSEATTSLTIRPISPSIVITRVIPSDSQNFADGSVMGTRNTYHGDQLDYTYKSARRGDVHDHHVGNERDKICRNDGCAE
jgi:hypothetical protein